jgi:hypothetical protein
MAADYTKLVADLLAFYETVQFFGDCEQLYQKGIGQGETTLARIATFKGQADIRIPMSYGLALIEIGAGM